MVLLQVLAYVFLLLLCRVIIIMFTYWRTTLDSNLKFPNCAKVHNTSLKHLFRIKISKFFLFCNQYISFIGSVLHLYEELKVKFMYNNMSVTSLFTIKVSFSTLLGYAHCSSVPLEKKHCRFDCSLNIFEQGLVVEMQICFNMFIFK